MSDVAATDPWPRPFPTRPLAVQLTKQQKNLALETAELRRLLIVAQTENNREEEQRLVRGSAGSDLGGPG